MAQLKRELELSLKEITVDVTGTGVIKKTSHLITAELLWARTGVARKAAVQPCTLVSGKADWDTEEWSSAMLFKENIAGRFALQITVSEVLDDETLEKLLRITAGAAINLGTGFITGLLAPLGSVAKAPLNAIAKDIAKYPGPKPLAEGVLTLEAGELPVSGGETLLTLPLKASSKIIRVTRKTTGKQSSFKRTTLLAKGSPNGSVIINLRSL